MNAIQNSIISTQSSLQSPRTPDPSIAQTRLNFKCEQCCIYFSSKHCLIEHGYRHSGERTYSCRLCEKTFKYASQLSVHKKYHFQRHNIRWPKLTELLKSHKEAKPVLVGEATFIELPRIFSQKMAPLPRLSSLQMI